MCKISFLVTFKNLIFENKVKDNIRLFYDKKSEYH